MTAAVLKGKMQGSLKSLPRGAVRGKVAPVKRHTRFDEVTRLVEMLSTLRLAAAAGPLFPLEWALNRGLAAAERRGVGFFVPVGYVLARMGDRLLTEIPAVAIKKRLRDWIQWNGQARHIDTRFLGAGDWSAISNSVTASSVFQEAQDLFRHGLDYHRSRTYEHYLKRAENGNPKRRNQVLLANSELVRAYFERFVELFRSIQTQGLLRKAALRDYPDRSPSVSPQRLLSKHFEKEIGVAIGSDGEIFRLPGGQHRAAIAVVLGYERLPAQVRLVHADWVRRRVQEYSGKTTEAILRGVGCL